MLTYGTIGAKETSLKNVSAIEIEAPNVDQTGRTHLNTVENDIKNYYDGWYLNFSDTKERNLGQAAVFGDIITFSTYAPDSDVCASEGESYLYGLYYKTGTAYYEGVLITDNYPKGIDDNDTEDEADDTVLRKIYAGKGYSSTPNIHTGENKGSKALLQTSTGAIIGIKHLNPGITKSGKVSWKDFE